MSYDVTCNMTYSLPLLEIQWNLYTADIIHAKKSVRFIQIFSKIVRKAKHSIPCHTVCLMEVSAL